MNNIFPINVPLTVVWHLSKPDGTPFNLNGYSYRLYYKNGKGKNEVASTAVTASGDTISFIYTTEMPRFTGMYSLQLLLFQNAKLLVDLNFNDAFGFGTMEVSGSNPSQSQESAGGTIHLYTVAEYYLLAPMVPTVGDDGFWWVNGARIVTSDGENVSADHTVEFDPETKDLIIDKGRVDAHGHSIQQTITDIADALSYMDREEANRQEAEGQGDYSDPSAYPDSRRAKEADRQEAEGQGDYSDPSLYPDSRRAKEAERQEKEEARQRAEGDEQSVPGDGSRMGNELQRMADEGTPDDDPADPDVQTRWAQYKRSIAATERANNAAAAAEHMVDIKRGPKGDQGNTGSSIDYPYELVNNVITDDATKGLSAAQGVVLDGKIGQLGQAVNKDMLNNYLLGADNTYVYKDIYGLVPGHKYRVVLKDNDWDMTGVVSTDVYIWTCRNRYNDVSTDMFLVQYGQSIAPYYDITIPDNSDFVRFGGRATSGTSIRFMILDITYQVDDVSRMDARILNSVLVGDGQNYVYRDIYGLVPYRKYRIVLKSTSWDLTGVTKSSDYDLFKIANYIGVAATTLFSVKTNQTPESFYDVTIPASSDFIRITGLAATGENVYFSISDITDNTQILPDAEPVESSMSPITSGYIYGRDEILPECQEDDSDADFSIGDSNGNVVLSVKDGKLKPKTYPNKYYGQKIEIAEYTYGISSYMTMTNQTGKGNQGMDIWGGVLFSAKDTGYICLHDFVNKTSVPFATVQLESASADNHCNCLNLAPTQAEGSPYPLMYISVGKVGAAIEYYCHVEKIIENNGVYSSQLVQTIILDATGFTAAGYQSIFGSPLWLLDKARNKLWAFSAIKRTTEAATGDMRTNKYVATCFNVPDISISNVTLTADDIVKQSIFEFDAYATQGGCIYNGIIYYSFGFGGTTGNSTSKVRAFDTDSNSILSRIDLAGVMNNEPEDCCIYNGKLYMQTVSTSLLVFNF